MASALTAIPQSTYAFFDPLDTLDDTIGHEAALHARVMNSMVWRLDSMCISQARTILFARYTNADKEIDKPFETFCLDVHSQLKHESLYNLASSEETNEQTLATLMALRQSWHDAAASAASRNDQDYTAKTLRQLVEAEKAQPASIDTRTNFAAIAKAEANGDPIEEKLRLDAMMQSHIARSTKRAVGNRELIPVVLEILRTVSSYAPADARFDQLPARAQRSLTSFAITAIDRTRVELAERQSPTAFQRSDAAARKGLAAIDKVLTAKYHDTGELENTSSPLSGVELEHQRQQKRVACSID